jgi:hypothetical protein
VKAPTTAVCPPFAGDEIVASSMVAPAGIKGDELPVDVQVDRSKCPCPAGIWSPVGPEIEIDARQRRYAVARLIEEHGGAKLTELLVTLAHCPKARSASMYERCKAVYEGPVDGLG